jgi:hypothetical protein
MLLSYRRRILGQEIDVKQSVRRVAQLKDEFSMMWPSVPIPQESVLEQLMEGVSMPEGIHPIDFDKTRTGRTWKRELDSGKDRVEVMTLRARNDLSLRANYGISGSGSEASESWEQFGTRDSRDWSINLQYEVVLGRDSDRLNLLKAEIQKRRGVEQYKLAKRKWILDRLKRQQDFDNALEELDEKKELLFVSDRELKLSKIEMEQGLLRLQELFEVERSRLSAEINLKRSIHAVFLADLSAIYRDETLLERLP